jgi:rubrerythrin
MAEARAGSRHVEEFIDFRAMGDRAEGAHRCSECGYGVAVFDVLPRCPMCGGEVWEASDPRPPRRTAESNPSPAP